MKALDEMISRFDSLTLRLVSSRELREREEEFRTETPVASKAIYEAYDSVDTKTTAVLQHVSIMIAVTGILYSQTGSLLFKWFFGLETLCYVLLALLCLRLLMSQHHSPTFPDTMNVAAKEATLDLTAKLTFLVSVFLIGTVVLELVAR
jgi:hypothetical protein